MKTKIPRLSVLIILAAFAFGKTAGAATIVVGTPDNPAIGNCIPFTCNFNPQPGFTYQQVYSQTEFSKPANIKELIFYQLFPNVVLADGVFTFSLSTTSKPVNGLSTTSFADNLGSDNKIVFSATLPAMTDGELIIPLDSSFNYNPKFGNLLMTISSSDFSTAPTNGFFQKDQDPNGPMSRLVLNGLGQIEAQDLGLITGFVIPNPVPPTLPLFATGLVGLGLLGWRRKKRANAAG